MSVTFTFRNYDEFVNRLREVGREFPKTSEKYLRRAGNTLKRNVIKAMPVGKSPEKRRKWNKHKWNWGYGRNTKKLKYGWTAKTVGASGGNLEYQLYTRAPHYHLVERGHELIIRGKSKGFRQGKFFFEKTANAFGSSGELRKIMEKFMQEIKRKIEGS